MNSKVMLLNEFPELYEEGIILFDEPMSQHCTFQIGGAVDAYCIPKSIFQIASLVCFAIDKEIPFIILGRGSNILVSDNGLRGMVISTQALQRVKVFGDCIYAECGVELKDLSSLAMQHSLSGLEFACGIPGSVGGAVYMNAGAYEGEISQVLQSSIALVTEPSHSAFPLYTKKISAPEHGFGYRYSTFQSSNLIHLSSVFCLKSAAVHDVESKMQSYQQQRESKQPLNLPSAGSVFKRPQGSFTGKLIDECGLRGFSIGAAMISEVHCGFIVNTGGATAHDVMMLIRHVQESVFKLHKVLLEPEIRLLGEM